MVDTFPGALTALLAVLSGWIALAWLVSFVNASLARRLVPAVVATLLGFAPAAHAEHDLDGLPLPDRPTTSVLAELPPAGPTLGPTISPSPGPSVPPDSERSTPSASSPKTPSPRPTASATPDAPVQKSAPPRPSPRRPTSAQPDHPTGACTHVVLRGDTLWAIARDHLPAGASDARIAASVAAWHRANERVIGPDPDLIHPGHELTAPEETSCTPRPR